MNEFLQKVPFLQKSFTSSPLRPFVWQTLAGFWHVGCHGRFLPNTFYVRIWLPICEKKCTARLDLNFVTLSLQSMGKCAESLSHFCHRHFPTFSKSKQLSGSTGVTGVTQFMSNWLPLVHPPDISWECESRSHAWDPLTAWDFGAREKLTCETTYPLTAWGFGSATKTWYHEMSGGVLVYPGTLYHVLSTKTNT